MTFGLSVISTKSKRRMGNLRHWQPSFHISQYCNLVDDKDEEGKASSTGVVSCGMYDLVHRIDETDKLIDEKIWGFFG